MSVFLAVFINCGTLPQPKGEPQVGRVCIASVLHAIQAPLDTCTLGAAAEANAAELRLVKGGFKNTINSYQCFTLSDESASDASLARYMREQYGANSVKVVHHDFKDGEFLPRKVAKGQTL